VQLSGGKRPSNCIGLLRRCFDLADTDKLELELSSLGLQSWLRAW
jgi:hypothetical protein